jgi:hypothetical protein
MPTNRLRLAAAVLTLWGVAACDRPGGNGTNLALNDTPARATSSGTRDASSPYPSAVAAPAEAPAPTPRADSLSREALSDTAISSRTRSAIVGDPAMAGADVSVNTDRGVVSLTGTVKSHEQAAIASSIAQRNDGVMRIENHLSPPSQ